jgi:hypothetical protein
VITDFSDDLDEIQISSALWGGGARTVEDILDPANVTVTAAGLNIVVAPGHVLDLHGIFDATILYNDLTIL